MVAAAVAVVVIAGAAVAGAKLLNRPAGTSPPVYVTVPPHALGPAATVRAFYEAINARNYPRAWELDSFDHSSETYQQFVRGYVRTTKKDVLTILSTNGSTVAIRLTAYQAKGTVHHFQGTYTVINGTITDAQIYQVSG